MKLNRFTVSFEEQDMHFLKDTGLFKKLRGDIDLKEVLSNKVFIYLLMSLIAILFGVNNAEGGAFMFK